MNLLFCSLDSFLVSMALGLTGSSAAIRRQLIIAFAVCDFVATGAGMSLYPHRMQVVNSSPLVFFILAAALGLAGSIVWKGWRGALWLPLLFSIDNFFAGLIDPSGHAIASSCVAAMASGLLAWIGFEAARLATPFFSRRSAIAAGAGLIVFGLILSVIN